MIPILQAPQKKPTFGQRLSEGVGRGLDMASQMMQEHQQRQMQEQQRQATKSFGEQLGIGDISNLSPDIQKEVISKLLSGQQKQSEFSHEMDYLAKQHEYEKEIENLKLAGKTKEAAQKKQEAIKPFQGALDVVNKMRQLRKKGNLGLFSKAKGLINEETRKHRGEYETLGNSLISFSSTIPIRNQKEFEQLTGKLNDPNITDAEAEGVLNAIERIINNSMAPYLGEETVEESETPKSKPEKRKRPLSSFER